MLKLNINHIFEFQLNFHLIIFIEIPFEDIMIIKTIINYVSLILIIDSNKFMI